MNPLPATLTKPARLRGLTTALLLVLTPFGAGAAPSVTNIRSFQQQGTKLVHIDYDLGGSGGPFSVSLQGSADGGATWTLPVASLSGKVGAGVATGRNLRITWNAGADWNGQVSDLVRFKVTANDTPPAPDGFALIPAGSFQMGDQSNPLVGNSDERPVHTVYVSAFYMAKHEVTKELWDSVRAWGLNNGYTDLPTGGGKAANHPVHSINWHAMLKWCNACSQKEGLTPCYTVSGAIYKTAPDSTAVVCNWSANGYRLPTEAEWEKAARGGVVGKNFPWGTDTISHSQANYCSSASFAYDVSPTRFFHPAFDTGISFTYSSPVGSFAPNGYGLYDMSGNNREWCWDWYSTDYYASSPGTDPRGSSSGSGRVFRGGGWGSSASGCRVAARVNWNPTGSNDVIGFRVVRSSVP